MDMLLDRAHIGMFEPQDVALLQAVFTRLRTAGPAGREEALARSIIKLYRHGVRDPQQLFETLRGDCG